MDSDGEIATLDDCSDQYAGDRERVLVTLLRGLGPWKESAYLIEGLTPRYLVSARLPVVPAHAGTLDVDIWMRWHHVGPAHCPGAGASVSAFLVFRRIRQIFALQHGGDVILRQTVFGGQLGGTPAAGLNRGDPATEAGR